MGRYFDYMGNLDDPMVFIKRIILTFGIIILSFVIYRIIAFLINRYVEDGKKGSFATRTIRLIIALLSVFVVFRLWFDTQNSLMIAIGLLFAIVSLSLKDLIVNIAGWAYMLSTRIVDHGDRIEIDGVQGDVFDIDLFETYVTEIGDLIDSDTPTGRVVSFPNKFIFEKKLYNYSRNSNFIWQEVYVTIPFDFDRDKALRVAGKATYEEYVEMRSEYDEEVLEELKKMTDLLDSTDKPQIRAQYDLNGVRIYVRYFTHYDDTGKNNSRMQFALVDSFRENGVPMIQPKWIRDVN